MKKILLPTDFSENAMHAIFYALKLFHKVPTHFHILNTYDPDPRNLMGSKTSIRLGMLVEALEKSSRRGLDDLKKRLEGDPTLGHHTFDFHSMKDELPSAVKFLKGKEDIDFIIMGTKGATGARKVFMGSNTVKTLKSIRNCPIIAVPESYNFQSLKRITFPTDFTRFYDKFELEPLRWLASSWESEIKVLHLAEEFIMSDLQNTNKKVLKDRLKELRFDFVEQQLEGDISKGILNFASEIRADLIAIIHYKHSFLEKLMQKAVVKAIGYKTEIPLLVLPEMGQSA